METGDKGSRLPVPTLVPEGKQIRSKSQFLSFPSYSDPFWEWEEIWCQRSLHETVEKALPQGLVLEGREPWEGEQGRSRLDVALGGCAGRKVGNHS